MSKAGSNTIAINKVRSSNLALNNISDVETNEKIKIKRNKNGNVALKIERFLCYLFLLIITVLCLFSFYILIINATRSHSDIQKGFSFVPGKSFVKNFNNTIKDPSMSVLSGLKNSLIISIGTAVLSVYFSALTAYAIHAYDFKFKKQIFAFILLIMMIPTQVTSLGFYKLIFKMKLMNSFIPLIVPSIAAPVVFFFVKQYMDSVLPKELLEAARIDGAGEFRIFNTIVLPIMKPAIAVQMIFQFVSSWNNYFIPQLILTKQNKKTVPILIATLRGADFMKFDMGKVYMMLVISIIPVVLVYLFLSKYIIRGITLGSVKG